MIILKLNRQATQRQSQRFYSSSSVSSSFLPSLGTTSTALGWEDVDDISSKNNHNIIKEDAQVTIFCQNIQKELTLNTSEDMLLLPFHILKHMPPKKDFLVAKINDATLWDLSRPLERDCRKIEFLDFDSDDGKKVYWHSAAHLLGHALQEMFQDKVQLCDGPAFLQEGGGFFYEMFLQDKLTISTDQFQSLEATMQQMVKKKHKFERKVVSKETAHELFQHNPYKTQILSKIPTEQNITLYRCGSFIDLCRGAHVPHTGLFPGIQLTRCGASHWGDSSSENEEEQTQQLLQRVYGIAFPKKRLLTEWNFTQTEAKKRDHRVIGKNQELFLFHPTSPGSAFMLPHGTRILNRLKDFLRVEYKKYGYDEVMTPVLYKTDLWQTSGHLENYQDDMFLVQSDAVGSEESPVVDFGIKPMNCPGHCILFKETKLHSYRDLPVRYADFSTLHRNEATGALTGLTRVRQFHQDDGHIFCTLEQVPTEIANCLSFIEKVYKIFGFEFQLQLSTRPDQFMGNVDIWDEAESQLTQVLDAFGQPYGLNPGDGAFYGPKIDVSVTDALGRRHQCATIQLDFQLPERFDLTYNAADGQKRRPIIIHRAILGSLERFLALIIEHTAGKWPLWISPRQVAILPVSEAHEDYAYGVQRQLLDAGFYVDVAGEAKTLNKRIRESQMSGYNYIVVVGDREKQMNQVNVRARDHNQEQEKNNTTMPTQTLDIHAFISALELESTEFM